VVVLGVLVEHDPLLRAETEFVPACTERAWLWDGSAPVLADSAHVEVAVDVVLVQEAVADPAEEI
jgi:hypothetical protein